MSRLSIPGRLIATLATVVIATGAAALTASPSFAAGTQRASLSSVEDTTETMIEKDASTEVVNIDHNYRTASQAVSPDIELLNIEGVGTYSCELIYCSFTFTRAATRDIASSGTLINLCSFIPAPGNMICAAVAGITVATANLAKNRNACAAQHWEPIFPPLIGTAWVSVDNGPNCKD